MIWLIGCNGMLGKEVSCQLQKNNMCFVRTGSEVDICDFDQLQKFEQNLTTSFYALDTKVPENERKIDWIINCAAYTNVDKAEDDIENATKINTEGSLNLARMARKLGAKLIHISTDYVFSGSENKPYTENMTKKPLGVYGKTKADGEELIEKEMVQYFIIRTAWLYGKDGKNFVKTMLSLMSSKDEIKVVNDQTGTPTNVKDLASCIITLIKKTKNAKGFFGKDSTPPFGIYHFTNEGQCTWYDFAKAIYKYAKKYNKITNNCNVAPCSSADFPSKVKRPTYSVLSKEKVKNELKIKIEDWEKSLQKFIKEMV